MQIFYRTLIVLVLIFGTNKSFSQNLTILDSRNLEYNNNFPEHLLSGKSVVISSSLGLIPEFELKLHKKLRARGVDLVTYYRKEDIFAGDVSIFRYALEMRKRGIKNLILVDVDRKDPLSPQYKITITEFNRKRTFIEENQKAFRITGNNPTTILNNLSDAIKRDVNLNLSNFLIIDEPEYNQAKVMLKKGAKKIHEFPLDLAYTKLAVNNYDLYSKNTTRPRVKKHNEKQKLANQELAEIFAEYPYKADIINYDMKKEKQLLKDGYLFVLLKLYGKERKLKHALGYSKKEIKADSSLNKNQKVYKYYFKHLRNGNLFLGTEWNTSADKVEALKLFMTNFKKSMEKD